MEPATQSFDDNEIRAQLATAKYDQKWNILKPVFHKLWIDDHRELSELMAEIKASYRFDAIESQYKYQFNRKWKWKRNIPTAKKEALCKIRQTRAIAGKSTRFEYQGQVVKDTKLRRHLKEVRRRGPAMQISAVDGVDWKAITGSAFVHGNSIFLNWKRPYGTVPDAARLASSPMSISTPSDIVMGTSPTSNAPSPSGAPSPMTQVWQKDMAITRAYMLVSGQHTALMKSMGRKDRDSMSTWLYQFWVYAFKTAKYWGRGPRNWTVDILNFESFKTASLFQNPGSPASHLRIRANQQTYPVLPEGTMHGIADTSPILKPSPLCHWSIHYECDLEYEPCMSRTPSPDPSVDGLDEKAWRPWPSSESKPSLHQTLARGLGSNGFSDVRAEDLPIAVTKIVQASESTNHRFLEETLGFSIMARNFEMVSKILEEHDDDESIERIQKMMPIHLAINYLDGSKACCAVIERLLYSTIQRNPFFDLNNLGHTLFDTLMMTILKAHTSITPGAVDDGLRDEKSFAGEEVDICGRFDADSDSVRALVASGKLGIPFSWKHKFCHTSAQAICHCIIILGFKMGTTRIFASSSGLFLKHCVHCGLKMQLNPLHTIVLTAFGLGQFGANDEDLFGIIAVLLCILQLGADPTTTAEVSVTALFPEEDSGAAESVECSHEPLRGSQLAEFASQRIHQWSNQAKVGWAIFCHILRIAENTWSRTNELKDRLCVHDLELIQFSLDARLPTLHAAVQTELLTYRRLQEDDPWISPFFDMISVLKSLQTGQPFSIDLIKKDMMKPFCECGLSNIDGSGCPRAEHVMKYHFSNLEDWNRTTFLLPVEIWD